MLPGPPRRHRARPVADAPIDALLSRSEDLAKGWLLALLEGAPLAEAPQILATELTRDGPRVCDAMLRAIADDTDQRRLEPGGALEPLVARVGELAGASGAAGTSYAVDALQGVVWAALRSELRDPDPDLVSGLAERLAQVSELMRAAALRQDEDSRMGVSRGPGLSAAPEPRGASGQDPMGADPAATASASATEPPAPASSQARAAPPASSAPQPSSAPSAPPLQDEPEVVPRPAAPRSWGDAERTSPAPEALWVSALEDEIQRTGDLPLSLLLAELEDADRMLVVETDPRGVATFGVFAQAVRAVVRRQDILVAESESRAWIIARETGRGGAQALGARISAAVREGAPWRGAPMVASIGVAVLGEDGRTSSELIDSAEESRFAAEANGVDLIRISPDEGPAES
jgi:GGDEF domain-containing protein